jgi:type I restriction enzyme M protein
MRDTATMAASTPAPDEATRNGDMPFAKTLFEAADRLRGSVESAEYKHLVLGLLFLKYVSDSFQLRHDQLAAETRVEGSGVHTADEEERQQILEDRDEYEAENVFWVPEEARWDALLAAAAQPDVGAQIDRALEAVERENTSLRGVLPHVYARAAVSPEKLGELVTTIAKIGFGERAEEARDVLGRTYEYFIKTFARAEGHRGGEFYTPASVTRLLVEMLEPFKGRVYEPAFGSGGLFVQSGRFVQAHGGRTADIALYGQENNQATWRIGKMNLALHGLSGDLKLGNTLLDDQHRDLRADFIMANPPFNLDRWGASQVANDVRWRYGLPPDRNANYAWIQHFIHHLAPDGKAGFVMANGSLSSMQSGEGAIREAITRDDLIDCIIALPPQLFFTTPISVCLWFLDRNKASAGERDRRGETLFIDVRNLGVKVSRTQIELAEAEILRIARTYRAWRSEPKDGEYTDESGFCASATREEIANRGYVLTPGRYVGIPDDGEIDDEPLAERVSRLTSILEDQFAHGRGLEDQIRLQLKRLRL